MIEEVNKKNYVKGFIIIIAIILFLGALYFFIVYTFFVEDKTVPEHENPFLYSLSKVNPITLIFGEDIMDDYQSDEKGDLKYMDKCSSTDECSACLECVDLKDYEFPVCLYIDAGKKDSTGACDSPRFCNGEGECVECIKHSDCKESSKSKCMIDSGICVEKCPSPIDCSGRECGNDGCGVTCGNCLAQETCNPAGTCVIKNEDETSNTSDLKDKENTNAKIFSPTKKELISGYGNKNLSLNTIIDLKNLGLGEIGLKIIEIMYESDKSSDFIKISTTYQNITLFTGDIKNMELNNDYYYDLEIKLNSIEDNKADIMLRSINEKIPSVASESAKTDNGEINQASVWDLNETPKSMLNILFIIIGILATIVLIILLYFLITLFIKIKRIAQGKKDIKLTPELKGYVSEQELKINELLSEGYMYINKRDIKSAKEVYEKIKKIFNPLYDPDKRIYIKIGEYYKRIVKLDI